VNLLDVVVAVVAVAAMAAGWQAGFVARAMSWLGLGIGIYIGIRVARLVLARLQGGDQVERLVIVVSFVAGIAMVLQGAGIVLGGKIARVTMLGPARLVDRAAGALLGMVAVLALVWVLVPVLESTSGSIAAEARHSAIVRAMNSLAPRQPALIRELRAELEGGWLPEVFSGSGPSPNVGSPPAAAAVPASTVERAIQSTVKVTGVACNLVLDGSGFTALAPDLVVTNAHVVAGERRTFVVTPTGVRLAAVVVAFDERRDLALLAVPGLQSADPAEKPLPLGTPEVGSTAVSIGHPGGTDQVVVTPVRIAQEVDAIGRDLYDEVNTSRDVYILSANIQQGDSGSPVVGPGGDVEGVVFALAPDQPYTGYALADDELKAVYANSSLMPVSTGPCLDG
jgi:S1-C subfamily serine protease